MQLLDGKQTSATILAEITEKINNIQNIITKDQLRRCCTHSDYNCLIYTLGTRDFPN